MPVTRSALLESAARGLSRHGYDNLILEQVAREAGYTRGALYHHGVMHLGWVADGTGGYRGQMAVLVKPTGLLGDAYMAAIRPFRHLIVYPATMRQIEREAQAVAGDRTRAGRR